ncbi:MAG: HEPN domain-containing protein [Pseudomonadota bacterium]
MASKARAAFDKNAKDIKRLIELHEDVGGTAPGRRYGLEVLNKSAIVLITAFWEAYCEDIAAEGLAHIVKHAKSADALPNELKKTIAKRLKQQQHELEVWKIADDGWRGYLSDHLEELKKQRDRKLNTPKSDQIDELFKAAVGIEKMSGNWYWPKRMKSDRAREKLDDYVSLRGAIAHRGQHDTSVTKKNVTDYFELVQDLVSKTGGAVNSHVLKVTNKRLWPRVRPK